MKKRILIGVVILILAVVIGVAIVIFVTHESAAPAQPAEQKTEEQAKPQKDKYEEAKLKRKQEQESDKKFSALIDEGNKALFSDRTKADKAFKDALDYARTDEQKFKAWAGRNIVAKLLENGDVESIAAKNMMELAKTDREKANALEATADAAVLMKDYQTAVKSYHEAVDYHKKNKNIDMAWTALMEEARIMRQYIGDFDGAEKAMTSAWDIVEKSSMDEGEKNHAKWNICINRADAARLVGDAKGQVKWNREATKYDPSWQTTADIVENELKSKGLIE